MTIDDLIKELAGIYWGFFSDQTKAEGRAKLYRKSLSHLTPEQLDSAYSDLMRIWSPDKPQPPMPADILRHVHAGARTNDGAVNMRQMSDALPQLITDIDANWWNRSSRWVDGLIKDHLAHNAGHEEAVETELRANLKLLLRAKIHVHAQKVYLGQANIESFRLFPTDIERYLGKPGPMSPYIVAIREGRDPPKGSLGAAAKGRRAA
ncbi:MAG TPA: hypothetical protein VND94_00875 [Terriglobia bacterium]|nr:hypothetical protein [Terriglobia bacterium]